MRLAFTHINYIILNICADYEQRFLISAYINSFSLSDCKEMSSAVNSDSFSRQFSGLMGSRNFFQKIIRCILIGET